MGEELITGTFKCYETNKSGSKKMSHAGLVFELEEIDRTLKKKSTEHVISVIFHSTVVNLKTPLCKLTSRGRLW